MRAALRLIKARTKTPWVIDQAFLERLRDDGLDDLAIENAECVAFQYNWINRVADAVDFDMPSDAQNAKIAKALQFLGNLGVSRKLKGTPFLKLPGGRARATELEETRVNWLTREGDSEPSLRAAAYDFVTKTMLARQGHPPDALFIPMVSNQLPSDLAPFLKKLAEGAYRISDGDFDALREAGRSKGEIFELIALGSFAASLVGTDAVFSALHGEAPVGF